MKLSQKAKLLVLLLSGVFLFSCADKANNTDKKSNTDTTTIPTEPANPYFTEAGDYVEITPPVDGIEGAAPGVSLPGAQDYWKGVFVEGRKPVKISPYAIAKTEVTYKLWKEVHDWATGTAGGEGQPAEKYNFSAGRKGSKYGNSGNELEPVTMIKWNDAIVFCNAYTEMKSGNLDQAVYLASQGGEVLKDATATDVLKNTYMDKTKTGFRLPTEAEWELAARLQTDGSLSPLNRASGAADAYTNAEATKKVAWYSENSSGKTHIVGDTTNIKANAIGLYDISGNVLEWCFDYKADDATSADGTQNPVLDPAGPNTGSHRVIRGGSWYYRARDLLVGHRSNSSAGATADVIGLRLVFTTEPSMQIERPEHVAITPPAAGIAGSASGVNLPGTQNYWKGVFIEDRNPVKISPYAIAKTEVTYKLWKEVYDWNTANSKGYTFAAGSKGSTGSGNELEPVTKISWYDAIVFCNAYTEMKSGNLDQAVYLASQGGEVLKDATATDVLKNTYMDKAKIGFRLPTEAEWELAARLQIDGNLSPLDRLSGANKPAGFSGLTCPDGESWQSLYEEANRLAVFGKYWDGNNWREQASPASKTAVVKSKDANFLGLYDMSGNVWEWCFDYYADDAKSADGSQNPVLDPTGPSTGVSRVLRGGVWDDNAKELLVGNRYYVDASQIRNNFGLRLAWGVPKE